MCRAIIKAQGVGFAVILSRLQKNFKRGGCVYKQTLTALRDKGILFVEGIIWKHAYIGDSWRGDGGRAL